MALAGCRKDAGLSGTLQDIVPIGAQPRIVEGCTRTLGFAGALALFRLSSRMPDDAFTPNGAWSRETSLNGFVERQDDPRSNLLGRTVLDGKECLRTMTTDAAHILFGQNPGHYHGSENGMSLPSSSIIRPAPA